MRPCNEGWEVGHADVTNAWGVGDAARGQAADMHTRVTKSVEQGTDMRGTTRAHGALTSTQDGCTGTTS